MRPISATIQGTALVCVIVLLAPLRLSVAEEGDYDRARWDPLHFAPQIEHATDAQCLACHQEILQRRVRDASPAGLATGDVLAWYQTLDTYSGEQDTFHRRHLVTPYAQQVMALKCNTCHQGNDPREETAGSSATTPRDLIERKHVDPDICLMCHGEFNYEVMGVPGPWTEHGQLFGNDCLGCHAGIRTVRHQVNYLKPEAIEAAAQESSDVCYGCHGGRSWYRISYPYARNHWPGASAQTPSWAAERPTASQARFTRADPIPEDAINGSER